MNAALTNRQKQIIRLILAGKVNKEIAQELNVSNQWVRNSLAGAYKILGISNSRQLFPIADQVRAQIAE